MTTNRKPTGTNHLSPIPSPTLAGGHQTGTAAEMADGKWQMAEVPSAAFEPFITKPEVARRLNKKVRTVDNWMQQGLLPYYKIGRSVAFKWSEVEGQLRRVCHVCRGE